MKIIEKLSYINLIDTRTLGLILIELGGGRKKLTDKIDYSVGFSNVITSGAIVDKKTPLLKIHAKTQEDVNYLRKQITDCFIVGEKSSTTYKNIYKKIV